MQESHEPMDVIDLVHTEPSRENALFALAVAADFLASAREKFEARNHEGALSDCKSCMRMAASALLYEDGYIAGSLETTIYYLEKRYAGMFPLEDWRIVERINPDRRGGLTEMLAKGLGLKKGVGETFGTPEDNAKVALGVSEKFFMSVRFIFEALLEKEAGGEGASGETGKMEGAEGEGSETGKSGGAE